MTGFYNPTNKAILATMRSDSRSVIALTLIVLMLNTLGWSVSAEAFADWFATELAMEDVGPTNSNAPDDNDIPQQMDNHCNSGCHAPNLMQGLTYTAVIVHSTSPSVAIPQVVVFCSGNTPNSLYRPPRTFFLA
jgi:hypothetical protein